MAVKPAVANLGYKLIPDAIVILRATKTLMNVIK